MRVLAYRVPSSVLLGDKLKDEKKLFSFFEDSKVCGAAGHPPRTLMANTYRSRRPTSTFKISSFISGLFNSKSRPTKIS